MGRPSEGASLADGNRVGKGLVLNSGGLSTIPGCGEGRLEGGDLLGTLEGDLQQVLSDYSTSHLRDRALIDGNWMGQGLFYYSVDLPTIPGCGEGHFAQRWGPPQCATVATGPWEGCLRVALEGERGRGRLPTQHGLA